MGHSEFAAKVQREAIAWASTQGAITKEQATAFARALAPNVHKMPYGTEWGLHYRLWQEGAQYGFAQAIHAVQERRASGCRL